MSIDTRSDGVDSVEASSVSQSGDDDAYQLATARASSGHGFDHGRPVPIVKI